jgi:rhomboid protease GluP
VQPRLLAHLVSVPDELNTTQLPAPSQHKAMEWSLVLASQNISHLIASPDESGRWSLRISRDDVPRAAAVIRQYELENRPRPWQQQYLEGRVTFDWVALIWGGLLLGIHALSEQRPWVEKTGVMHGADVIKGEWWRLVTATQLHADWGHLASNLSIGVILLGLVMGRWGTAIGLLAALLAGIGGNLANLLIRPEAFSLGASTVVMGCLGLLACVPRSQFTHAGNVWRGLLSSISGAVLLFVLLGLDPRSDVLAHIGGFVAGLGLSVGLRASGNQWRGVWQARLAALLTAIIVLLSWWCALK